jgi:serine/threonine-protein kinase
VLVPGEALSTILEREHVLSTDKVLDIVAQTSAALQAAHAAGLVHRDIKPGNLLITPDGRVKITDFGIARIADQVPLTATGQVMGTVQYLSPEQASGHPASPTTDIYSLGIVAYEALAGRRPFTGESQVAIAMAQINETPPDLPVTVSEPVRNLVYACIAKNPAERPQSAAHLARAATALRRGDVQAASAAVPAVLGVAGATAATMLMPQQGATAATTVLPSAAGVPGEPVEETEEKKRSPWTWPLIVLIAILAMVLIGTIIALALNSGDNGDNPTTAATTRSTPSSAPPSTTAPPPTPDAPETIQIDRNSYIGMNIDEAAAAIEALGLPTTRVEGAAATEPGLANTVSDVNPSGPVPPGTTIELTYLGAPVAPSAPSSAPTTNAAQPVKKNTDITVNWSQQSCPAGQELSGYELAVTGDATVPNNPVFGPGTTSATVKSGDVDGGSFDVTFRYFCGQLDSPFSPALTVDIE